VILGAVLYRFFIAAALNADFMGLKAQDLNLVTAVLVAVALLVPTYKRKLAALLPTRSHGAHAVQHDVHKEAR
jgi:putative ABC transport system permease protein